jgi:hypothetical protein
MAKEVGRVSIRVVPDLDEFRNKLKAELEALERKVAEIKVGADTTKLRQDVQAATKGLDAAVKVTADTDAYREKVAKETGDVDAVVNLDAKDTGIRAKAKELIRNLPEAKIPVKLDEPSMDRYKARMLGRLQSMMSDIEANIPLTFNGELLRNEAKALEKELTGRIRGLDPKDDEATLVRLRNEINDFYNAIRQRARETNLLGKDVKAQTRDALKLAQEKISWQVELDTAVAELTFDAIKNRIAQEKFSINPQFDGNAVERQWEFLKTKYLRKRVVVDVDVDRNRIQRTLAGAFAETANAASLIGVGVRGSLRAAESGVKSFTAGLSAGVRSMLRLGEAGAIVAGVVAIAAPAFALLTGSLVALPGIIAGIATPIAAIALGMDGIKKAAEVVKPAFEDLKTAVSGAFEQGFTPVFQNLADKLFPRLQAALPEVAKGLSTLFKSFGDTVTGGGNLDKIEGTIRNIASAISAAAPGIQSFTNAFIGLVNSLSGSFLSGLSQSFNRLGAEFDSWVAKVTANGQLQAAMDTLKGTLGEIGGTIKDIASWSFDNLADPVFGQKMKQFAADLRSIVNDLLPLLKSGFEDVATIINGIVKAIDAIKGAASTFEKLTDFGPGVKGISGAKQTEGFLGLFGKDGVLGDNAPFRNYFSQAPKEAEKAGAEAAQKFQAGLSQIQAGSAPGGDITQAIQQQLGQITSATAEAQKAALTSVFQGTGVGDAVRSQLSQQLQGVLTEAQTLVSTIGPQLQTALDEAIKPVSNLPVKIGESFGVAAAAIIGAFGPVLEQVRIGADGIGDALSSGLGNLYQRVYAAFAGVAGAVVAGMSVAGQAAASGATTILQAVQAGLSALPAVVQAMFSAVPATIQGAMGQAVGTVASVCGQIVQTMLGYAGAAQQAGAAIGASFAQGLASQTGLVASSASALMSAAKAFFPQSPAKEGPFSGSGWVDRSGEAIGISFAQGMKDSSGSVVSTAKELMQAIKDVFGDSKNIAFNFNFGGGAQLSSGLSQLQSSFDTLTPSAAGFSQQLGQVGDSLTNINAGDAKARIKDLSQSLAELEIQRKTAEAAKDSPGADQAAIKAQLAQIANQKNLLGLERDKLNYALKYGGQVSDTTNNYKDMVRNAGQLPLDFGKAVGGQFMSDLGISGQGAISSLASQALDYGSQFIFNVGNMDDALQGQKRLQSQQMLGYVGR